ncbi:MAG: hypothetical protein WBI04_08090 [Trichlorobacter sp.]|jgi:hypothetical protein
MSLLEELCQAVREQHRDGGLPDELLASILSLAENPAALQQQDLIKRLLEQLRNFDLYAGAACFSDANSVQDIQKTISLFSQVRRA